MFVGEFLNKSLPTPLIYYYLSIGSMVQTTHSSLPTMHGTSFSVTIFWSVTAGAFLVVISCVFIICCVVCHYRHVVKNVKKNQDLINLVTMKHALKEKGIFKLLLGSNNVFTHLH